MKYLNSEKQKLDNGFFSGIFAAAILKGKQR
jgi:hypothetical protein